MPLDFAFSEEQELFRETLREFCQREIAPRAREMDTKMEIPDDLIDKMAEMKLFGLTIPEEYGGVGEGCVMATIAAEEIARADVSVATAVLFLVNAGWGFLLSRYASDKLKEEILPKVAEGKALIGIASTEPQGGSDVSGIRTKVERKDGKIVVNGEKVYISLVREIQRRGGGYFALGTSDPKLRHRGVTTFFLPLDAPGVSTTFFEDMGRNALSTGGFRLVNVELPEHYVIGEWNKGFYYAMEGFQFARVLVAAACIGCASRVLEIGMEYVKQRELFGKPLAKYEGIQFPLADDYAAIEADRLLVYRAAWFVDEMYRKPEASKEDLKKAALYSYLAKLRAPYDAYKACNDVQEWFGAYGYTKECDVEMAVRGVRSYSVGAEGGQNIMRIIIARELLGREYLPY